MKISCSLHHTCHRVAANSLEFAVALFRLLGCKEVYRHPQDPWVMLEQEEKNVRLQFFEIAQIPESMERKMNSHIAFLSNTPVQDIETLRKWAEAQGKKFTQGTWSDKEFYFDLPEVFVDFVIEVMHPSILEN